MAPAARLIGVNGRPPSASGSTRSTSPASARSWPAGPAWRARLFTPGEQRYAAGSANPVPSLAARFAAKEAVMKALGVGLGAFGWADVEVVRAPGGSPGSVGDGPGRVAGLRPGRRHLAVVDHPHRARSPRPWWRPWRDPGPDPGGDGRGGPGGPGAVEVLIDRAGFCGGQRRPPDARTAPTDGEWSWSRAGATTAPTGGCRPPLGPSGGGRFGGRGRRPQGGAERLPSADLVIDAAYGTGLSRPYAAARSRGALGAGGRHPLWSLGGHRRPVAPSPATGRRRPHPPRSGRSNRNLRRLQTRVVARRRARSGRSG